MENQKTTFHWLLHARFSNLVRWTVVIDVMLKQGRVTKCNCKRTNDLFCYEWDFMYLKMQSRRKLIADYTTYFIFQGIYLKWQSKGSIIAFCMLCKVCWSCMVLFDLILYVPSTIFQLYREGSSWVEPVLS